MTVETYKIFGPPGTGKTTKMLNLIEQELEDGTEPSEICYISFTRAAVQEARARAMSKFAGLDLEKDLGYFRTMHSLAYRVLGLNRDRIMAGTALFEFGERSGYRFDSKNKTKFVDIEEVMLGDSSNEISLGSYLLSVWDYIRNKKWGLDEGIRLYAQPIQHQEITSGRADLVFKDFVLRYEREKQENNLLDFTDMLLRVKQYAQPLYPPVKAVFADEVQDFSPLQWDVLHVWATPAYDYDDLRLFLAGDDDQAIFTFQSATPELFLKHLGTQRVLARSWRLPSRVWEYSQALIIKNKNRLAKQFTYHKEGGEVVRSKDALDLIPAIKESITGSNGSWFILGRNRYLLERVASGLENKFIPFTNRRGPSVFDSKKLIKACELAVKLNAEGGLTFSELDHLIGDFVDSQQILAEGLMRKTLVIRGAKKQIEEKAKADPNQYLTQFDIQTLGVTTEFFSDLSKHPLSIIKFAKPLQRNYVNGAYEAFGPKVFEAASKISIGTIHSAKGAEADNVVLLSDVSNSCYKNIMTDPEGERRVFYVGATRAKQNLYLVRPQTSKFYEL